MRGRVDEALLLDGAFALGVDRVKTKRGGRRAARPDEDAITLAAEAMSSLCGDPKAIGTLILATTTPVYRAGGNVQTLAELLGLDPDTFALELTATDRDGLAAVRLGIALANSSGKQALICASNHSAAASRVAADGAVAFLIGPAGEERDQESGALARLRPVGSHVEEIHDAWLLEGAAERRTADRTFVESVATRGLAISTAETALAGIEEPGMRVAITGPSARAAREAELALGGSGEDLSDRIGVLGTAHPLLRIAHGLDSPSLSIAISSGIAEVVSAVPAAAGRSLPERVEGLLDGGREVERAMTNDVPMDFVETASAARSWRDRGRDLRLDGIVGASPWEARGRVYAETVDLLYPGARETQMALVDLEGGGRFYGQVTMGDRVAIDDSVRLVPRRLHDGGGIAHYFWKVQPWE